MQKVKSFLSSVNFPLLVYALVGARMVVTGASFGEAVALVPICALHGFSLWLASNVKPDPTAKIEREVHDLKVAVSSLVVKNTIRPNIDNGEVKRFF